MVQLFFLNLIVGEIVRSGCAGISKEHHPDLEPFYQDVADA